MESEPINTEKYSEIFSEIDAFIEAKSKKPTEIRGNVKGIDLINNILTIELDSKIKPDLSARDLILIREDAFSSTGIRALVQEVHKSVLKIETKVSPSQFESKPVIIDTNKKNVILERLKNINENIKKGNLVLDNIRILDFLIGENEPQYVKKNISFISKELNENQKDAVEKSIEAKDFHLIIGPPGTGKTYVIEELVRQFSMRNKKILITAWTNLAVDNVIKRLNGVKAEKILRIGPTSELDCNLKKYSLFEKMTKHKDWPEIERNQKNIEQQFDTLPKIKEQRTLLEDDISKLNNEIKNLKEEQNNLKTEEQKYQVITSNLPYVENLFDLSPINNELIRLNQKSEECLDLSKNILQMNDLKSSLPNPEYIQKLKNKTRKIWFSIISKSFVSFLSSKKDKELEKLKIDYKKNKQYLDEVSENQKRYRQLKEICDNDFAEIYPNNDGTPDMDSLDLEFQTYKKIKNQYLPILKEYELLNVKKRKTEINKDVYRIYLESLKIQIDLIDVKIKGLKTEIFLKTEQREDLNKKYKNLLNSLNLNKRKTYKLKKSIISDLVNKADLIAATAVSSAHYFLDGVHFDVMLMDESSQVASFMSLLPLSKCKKFILVGDNKQLQPIEDEDISQEMNLSIFNRLFKRYPNASTLLTTQYRMHKKISKIASEIFYEGKLITSEKVAEKILEIKESTNRYLDPKIPVLFVDTSKTEYYEDEIGSGCSNTKEAEYVAYIVELFIKNGIKEEQIGIVTPYVKQKSRVKDFLKSAEINNVEVDTVHKFQGREKDIIILSFARSKKYSFPNHKLAFIENETLVNVAITRAKRKLILVGNTETLKQSNLLNKVIDKVGRENIRTLAMI